MVMKKEEIVLYLGQHPYLNTTRGSTIKTNSSGHEDKQVEQEVINSSGDTVNQTY